MEISQLFGRPPRPTDIRAAVIEIADAVAESRPLTPEEVKAVLTRLGGGLVEAIRIATGALATLARLQHPRIKTPREKLEDGRNADGFWILDSTGKLRRLYSVMMAAAGNSIELMVTGDHGEERRFAHRVRTDERGNLNFLELTGQGILRGKLVVTPASFLPRSFQREITATRDTVRDHMGSLLHEILPELNALKSDRVNR